MPDGKVGVVRCGPVPPVPELLTDIGEILTRHDGMTRGGMAEVMPVESGWSPLSLASRPWVALGKGIS